MVRTRLILGLLVVVGASAAPSGRRDEHLGGHEWWERRVEHSPGLGSNQWEQSYGPLPPPREVPADWRRVERGRRPFSRPVSSSLAGSATGRSGAPSKALGAGVGSDEWEQKFGPVRRVQGGLSNVGRQSSLPREDGSWKTGSGMHARLWGGSSTSSKGEEPRGGEMQSGRPSHKLVALRVAERRAGQPLPVAAAAAAEAARGRGGSWIVPALTRVIEDDGGVAPTPVARPRARTHRKRVRALAKFVALFHRLFES